MIHFRAFLACATLACGSLIAGQQADTQGTPPSPPSAAQIVTQRVASLTSLLSLNASQQASATTIFTAEETALAKNRSSFATAHASLKTAVEANDTTGIANAANEIGSLTAEQILAKGQADAAFYALLTSDQQTKYKQLRQFGMGPGGPGPGHGPGHPGGH